MESFIRKQEQRVRDYIQAYIAIGEIPVGDHCGVLPLEHESLPGKCRGNQGG